MKGNNSKSLLLTAALALTVSCAGEVPRQESRGQRADSIPGNDPAPERVVSLIPAVTELLVALGAGDRLIAVSESDSTLGTDSLPSVGATLNLSYERLIEIDPDLVIVWAGSAALLNRLSVLGMRGLGVEAETLEHMYASLDVLGRLFERSERADSISDSIRRGLQSVRDAVATLDKPSVFYVVWDDPPITTGSGTFINELIEIAGGRNIFADAVDKWPSVTFEAIVHRDPDVVIWPRSSHGIDPVQRMAGAGWREVGAIQESNVVVVDGSRFNRPGPGVVEAVRELAAVLHPEVDSHEWRD